MPARTVPETKEQTSGTMSKKVEIEIEGWRLLVSNLEKVLYPEVGFTKGQVIDYYIRIAPVLLAHLKNRPITLKRYPDGVDGFYFYEKQCPSHRPTWVKTTEVPSRGHGGKIDYCMMNDLPALVWAANLADLEPQFYKLGAPIGRPELSLDLDPGAPADILLCCQVGVWLGRFWPLGLQSFAKTSGRRNRLFRSIRRPPTRQRPAPPQSVEWEHPTRSSRMSKARRTGKVLIDWSQNDEHKTTVNVYSLRAKEQPRVSTPVTWEEVEAAVERRDASRLIFDSDSVLRRVEKQGDLFAPVLTLKQRLPSLQSIG